MEEFPNNREDSQNDFTFLSHSQEAYDLLEHMKPDQQELERLEERIRQFEEKNSQLSQYIQQIRRSPEKVRNNPNSQRLKQKIELMQKENHRLKEVIASAKISARPVELERVSSGIATPRNNKKEFFFNEDTHRNSMKSNPRSRRILEEIDDNFEKVFADNASTCLNYRTTDAREEPSSQQPELNRIEPLTETGKKIKNGLKVAAEVEYRKKEAVQRHLEEESEVVPQVNAPSKKIKNLKALEEYKNQLLQQLRNSQLKESQLQKILQELKKVHRSSLEKFNEVAQLLKELKEQSARDEDLSSEINLIERYQEALQLEQILSELQERNERLRREQDAENEQQTVHLTSLRRQLYRIVQKLGLKVDTNGLSLQESLEVLCSEIINNVYLPSVRSVSSTNAKLLKIKELTEAEKSHNNKVIAELKSREQALSRQLMSLQIGQNK